MQPSEKAKLAAINISASRVNAKAARVHQILTGFLGKKIKKADGTKTKALVDALSILEVDTWNREYLDTGFSSVFFNVKTCEHESKHGGSEFGCVYAENSVYLGEIENGILVKLCDEIRHIKDDWTEQAIEDARAKVKELEREISEVKENIPPHFRY